MRAKECRVEALRKIIDSVDQEIASGVARRLKLARKIGQEKLRRRLPLRDYPAEAAVLRRWRRRLTPAGVETSRGETLALWLIEESVRVQEAKLRRPPLTSSRGLEIAIVGGAGSMGRWLGEFLEAAGHHISVVDSAPTLFSRPKFPDVEAAARRADAVGFATPIGRTAPLLRRALAASTKPLIFDVLSVKAPIARQLSQAARSGRRVTSIHPLFGPSAKTLWGRNLLIVRCGNPAADAEVRALFSHTAATVTEVPLESHDRLMAESLGLSHAVNLLFLSALGADPLSPRDLAGAASTTFHRQASLARSVGNEGADLYLDIQAQNPYSRAVFRRLRAGLERLQEIVEARDHRAFQAMVTAGRAKLGATPEPLRP